MRSRVPALTAFHAKQHFRSSSKALLVRCAAATHASGALDDLSHATASSVAAPPGSCCMSSAAASGVLRLRRWCACPDPRSRPDPVAGDEPGACFTRGTISPRKYFVAASPSLIVTLTSTACIVALLGPTLSLISRAGNGPRILKRRASVATRRTAPRTCGRCGLTQVRSGAAFRSARHPERTPSNPRVAGSNCPGHSGALFKS